MWDSIEGSEAKHCVQYKSSCYSLERLWPQISVFKCSLWCQCSTTWGSLYNSQEHSFLPRYSQVDFRASWWGYSVVTSLLPAQCFSFWPSFSSQSFSPFNPDCCCCVPLTSSIFICPFFAGILIDSEKLRNLCIWVGVALLNLLFTNVDLFKDEL